MVGTPERNTGGEGHRRWWARPAGSGAPLTHWGRMVAPPRRVTCTLLDQGCCGRPAPANAVSISGCPAPSTQPTCSGSSRRRARRARSSGCTVLALTSAATASATGVAVTGSASASSKSVSGPQTRSQHRTATTSQCRPRRGRRARRHETIRWGATVRPTGRCCRTAWRGPSRASIRPGPVIRPALTHDLHGRSCVIVPFVLVCHGNSALDRRIDSAARPERCDGLRHPWSSQMPLVSVLDGRAHPQAGSPDTQPQEVGLLVLRSARACQEQTSFEAAVRPPRRDGADGEDRVARAFCRHRRLFEPAISRRSPSVASALAGARHMMWPGRTVGVVTTVVLGTTASSPP